MRQHVAFDRDEKALRGDASRSIHVPTSLASTSGLIFASEKMRRAPLEG